MRALILCLFALCFVGTAHAARPLPHATVMVAYATADWCPNCKIITPKLERVLSGFAGRKALFVTLDLTDRARIQQSVLLASALGIGEWLRAQGSVTGYVALIDMATKREITRFDRDSSEAQMREAIAAALAAKSGAK